LASGRYELLPEAARRRQKRIAGALELSIGDGHAQRRFLGTLVARERKLHRVSSVSPSAAAAAGQVMTKPKHNIRQIKMPSAKLGLWWVHALGW